ncbi:hypothetical protein XENOCAPTIV_023062 [Xenoophorus captivus]|uniref:Phosphatase and actin regulator 4 n=1 Tax=Xenoophorus captivus TaxID=1517983 RepID=A0ABV0Q6T6_9TELE
MKPVWYSLFIESDSHFVPDPEVLQDTLREPLPPKQPFMPPKWLMSSTPETGNEGPPRTPSNHPAIQYSSPSPGTSKPVRSVSSAGTSTHQPAPLALTPTSQGTKQPPLPPPKPVNRNNTAMLGALASRVKRKDTLALKLSSRPCALDRDRFTQERSSREDQPPGQTGLTWQSREQWEAIRTQIGTALTR